MTDLWDWADVAAIGYVEEASKLPNLRWNCFRLMVSEAIRYGYEQAQLDAPQFEITPRPAVLWFAEQMETKLRANDHKGGWLGIGMEYAQRRMRQEALDLEAAIAEYSQYNADGSLKTDQQELAARHRIILEAADVANFAMMIADEWRPRVTGGTVTNTQAAEVAPQSAAAIPPVASEFPRVWVTLARNPLGGSASIPVCVYSRHDASIYASEQYVHISELERLREAAGRAMQRALCMASEAISPDISDAIRAEFTRVFGGE